MSTNSIELAAPVQVSADSALRIFRRVAVPEGVALLAAFALLSFEDPRAAIQNASELILIAVYLSSTALAWRFHRSRVVLALGVLALAHLGLRSAAAGTLGTSSAVTIFHAVAFLLPLNLFGLTTLDERGVFTGAGGLRLAIVLLQIPLVWVLAFPAPAPHSALLSIPVIPLIGGVTPVPPLAVLAFAGGATLLTLRLLLREGTLARVLLWTLIPTFLALHTARDVPTSTTYLAIAGIILTVGVIEATYFMAYRDGLTGLPGRRAFNEALPKLGSQYSIAMVDVDRFKKFNDDHGHDVGDQVLKLVSTHLSRVTHGGRAYRYGGEEFAILFRNTPRDKCLPALDALRLAIKETRFTIRGRRRPRQRPSRPQAARGRARQLSVTVSIGVADRTDRRPTPELVVRAADRALYRAKQAGRDRIRR